LLSGNEQRTRRCKAIGIDEEEEEEEEEGLQCYIASSILFTVIYVIFSSYL
jgi:hypothetical protein